MSKEIFGYISLILTFISYGPYLWSIFKKATKPHPFTWVVWGTTESIACAAQYSGHAGYGAWAAGFSATLSFGIAGLALLWGEKGIARSDWAAFLAALSAIPLWYVTRNALSAVVLVTCIDALGYYPTIRKSYTRPREEMALAYALGSAKYLASLMALENYTLVTALYPVVIFAVNSIFVIMLLLRRAVMERTDVR